MSTELELKADSILNEIKGLQSNTSAKFEEIKSHGVALGTRLEQEANRIAELDKKLSSLEKEQVKAMTRHMVSEGEAEEFKNLNKQLKAQGRPEIKSENDFREIKANFEKYIRNDGKLLTHEEYKSINSIISTEGGYLVAPQYSEKLLAKAFDGRQLALNVLNTTIGSNVWKEYIDTADYDNGEYVAGNGTTPSAINAEAFKEIQIQVGEQYFGKKFHRGTLEDSFVNIESEVMNSIMLGMFRKDADGVVNGLGTSASPLRGLLTYTSGTSFGEIQQVTSTVNDAIDWDDVLEKLPAALADDYHGNAKFAMKRATFYSLIVDKDSQSRYQFGNQISFLSTNVGVQLGIMGYPVLFDAGMPAIANGALAVAFGDFEEAYRKVNRVGFSIHRNDSDPQYVTLTGRSRVGGGVRKYDAVKLLVIQ